METIWFCLVAFMILMYVLLDGFDLGAGILHRYVARTDEERRMVLRSIGPVWDGNEVWLLAAGGTLYFAFPLLYASAFSGFYLPLMMVLWMLMGRGTAIELRSHLDGPVWRPLWDSIFMISSALLAIFFGAALGNVVRGVPLNTEGRFFAPLWIGSGHEVGILDWYTVLVGLAAFGALAIHGAAWLNLRTTGPVQERSRKVLRLFTWIQMALTALVTVGTFAVQPVILEHLAADPWRFLFPGLAVAGLVLLVVYQRKGEELRPFLASGAYIAGMLGAVVAGVYPLVLPASNDPSLSLDIHRAAAPLSGLKIGLVWWIPGMIIALAYFTFLYRKSGGKVRMDEAGY